jgi:hypothetical protein
VIFSLASTLVENNTFNPYDIDETVTIDGIIDNIKNENHLTALIMSLRLN